MNFSATRTLFFLVLTASLCLVLIGIPTTQSVFPIATSSLIILISSFALSFVKNYPFSLRSTLLIFVYFFFGIVPIITYANNITYWGAPAFTDHDYLVTNLVILYFLANYFLIEFLAGFNRTKEIKTKHLHCEGIVVSQYYTTTLLALSAIVVGYKSSIFGFDFYSLVTAGRLGDGVISESSQIQTLALHWFITPILSICLIFQLQIYKKIKFQTIILFLFLILAASPVSISRFSTGAFYLPILFFSRFLFIFPTYNLILFSSLVIIFPALHLLRQPDFLLRQSSDFRDYWLSIFYSGDFDAYQSLMLVIKHDVVTYGNQLLGPLLFFIPRAIWSEKPVGSGEFLSKVTGLAYDNISASLLTEAYVNFGLIGVGFLGVLCASLFTKFDYDFWSAPTGKSTILMRAKYIYSIPVVFFMMRGDLLSSFAALIAIILAIEFVYLIVKRQIGN